MAQGYVQVPPDSTGKKVDCVSVSASGNAVLRQVAVIGDPTASTGYATVTAGSLQVFVKNASVAVTGMVSITGTVALAAGAANIGTINNISATVNVAGALSIGALSTGTNNIGTVGISSGTFILSGTVDGISATVTVVGNVNLSATATVINSGFFDSSAGSTTLVRVGDSANSAVRVNIVAGGTGGGLVSITGTATVVLGAGAANIGTLNNISATVIVAGIVSLGAGTNLIGAVSNAAGTALMGAVSLAAGTANIGFLNNISATVIVAGVVSLGAGANLIGAVSLAAGTSNIGSINNISATVIVAGVVSLGAGANLIGAVSLAAGTANIGFINNISAVVSVNVVAASAGVVLGVSLGTAVVLAAGAANIGSINNISAVVSVNIAAQSAGNILAVQGAVGPNASITAGNSPILIGGRVKTSASTTATAHAATFLWMDKAGRAIVQMNAASLKPSATHGPKTVTLSASANTVLVASAGTACIFVDSLLVTSNLAAVTRCDIYETPSSAAPEVSTYLAIGGGGYTQRFDPPWQLSAGQALSARLKPSASAQVLVMVHFHVGPN